MRVLGVLIAVGLSIVAAPAAQAEQRYAAPGGAGADCTQQQPCSLADAVNNASNGDEVIVAAGEYTISGAPLHVVYSGLHLHGDFSGPMPSVTAELGGLPAIQMSGDGSLVSYLEVRNVETEGIGIRCAESTRVERVSSTGEGEGAAGLVQVEDCLVRDSLLRAVGTNALGMESLGTAPNDPSGTVRNVTAIATGQNSAGIQSRYSYIDPGERVLFLANTIAQGESDLRTEDSSDGPGRIVVSNSNFDVVKEETPGAVTGVGNQTVPPLFLSPGDFRQAPGSPTIDAGSAVGIGSLDLAGNSRNLGAGPDIGAFEFVPPPPPGWITSLAMSPKAFLPLRRGGAVASATKGKAKRGATVRYALTAAAAVTFTVERGTRGRRVGGKCVKQTKRNRDRRKCARYKRVRGSFTHQGAAGQNKFRFSGRIGAKALKPGRYRLVGSAGDAVKRVAFRIVR